MGLHIVTIERHRIAFGIVVEIQDGVHRSLVALAHHLVTVCTLEFLARLVAVIALEGERFHIKRQTEPGRLAGILERLTDVEFAQEQVACRQTHVDHSAKRTRTARHQAHSLAIVTVGEGGRGIILGRGLATGESETGIARRPDIFGHTSAHLLTPHVVLALVIEVHVFEVELEFTVLGDGHGIKRHQVVACPRFVLRGYRVAHGALAEVLHTAARGHDGRALGQFKLGSKGGDVRFSAHGELDVCSSVQHIDHRICGLVEHLGRVICMQPGTHNVAFGIGGLVLKARSKRQGTEAAQ